MQHDSCARLKCLVLGVALLAGAGCKRSPPPETQGPNRVVEKSSHPAVQQRYDDEVWDDPKLLREDRLQFVWKHPDEERDSIWSMRLDGTDIRRVAKPDLLYSAGARNIDHVSARSPDRRYIAFDGDMEEVSAESGLLERARFLVDLREKRVHVMLRESNRPSFMWTPDSRAVLFYGGGQLWKYDVQALKLEKLPMVYSRGLHLLDGGKRILAVRESELGFYDLAGQKLKVFPIPYEAQRTSALSPDGELLFLMVWDGSVVIRPEQPDQPLFRDKVHRLNVTFGPDGKGLFYAENGEVRAVDLTTHEDRFVASFPFRSPGELTLVRSRKTR